MRDTARQALPAVSLTFLGSTTKTGPDGCAPIPPTAGSVVVQAPGFASQTLPLHAGPNQVVLLRVGSPESVTVFADRALPGIADTASSVAVLDAARLATLPGLALDDRLRSVAGFQLFRRTSSWTANPTTQGVSLRGLGSTAASRTFVVSDQVPFNDPFGGWIHWNELPSLAIQQAVLTRGGSADLYGSSAIGGVVDLVPVTPKASQPLQLRLDASGATEDTSLADALLVSSVRSASVLLAASELRTGGYIPTAPAARGSADIPSDVAAETGRAELRTQAGAGVSAFLRGNVLNEERSNGTPLQTNGTRLWRYVAGGDLNRGQTYAVLRLFGSRETYRQSFSSLTADRNTERLTRLQAVPSDELGFVASASHAFPRQASAALGVDLRDIRASDRETSLTATGAPSTVNISARQRETGGYAAGIWQPRSWSVSASVRVDSFRTLDSLQTSSAGGAAQPLPAISELISSPHAGIVWRVPHTHRGLPQGLALTGSAFRAFRGPTLNELYRTGQVGQQTTLANSTLLAERATGFEAGGEYVRPRLGHVRATYFWTEVNRPVSAVLLSQTATAQTLQRQNLGQIRSRGLMIEAATESRRGLDVSVGYQLAVATVTQFNSASAAQRNLTGNWIPQVPRQAVTASANYAAARVATFHLFATYTGQQFDDAENAFRLRPYARFDLQADRVLRHGFVLTAGAQNVFNRSIEAGRTPLLTLAAPRLVQAGIRYSFSR